MWVDWAPHMSNSNAYIVSFFHGSPQDGPNIARHIDMFLSTVSKLRYIVTSSTIVERRLLGWGIPQSKVIRIPLGVDTGLFTPPVNTMRSDARKSYDIPEDKFVIGSFQKDGIGWGEGNDPKLIKGPDIFADVLENLSSSGVPILAFLSGPSRGYLKHRLAKAGIPFIHSYPKTHKDLVSCYHALDAYLITSREEGGPLGLLESMASGVPVVSTRVGMAPDLITNGRTGFLANVDDSEHLALLVHDLYTNSRNSSNLRDDALIAVKECDWKNVALQHWEKLYFPLLY